jgi:hypothetical protein
MDLIRACYLIENAKDAHDLFDNDEREAKLKYQRLARIIHPDVTRGNKRAEEAFKRLTELWVDYRKPAPEVIHGDIADLFTVPSGLMKIPREVRDNDLMEREARALKRIRKEGKERYWPFVSELIFTERQRDPATGIVRRANTIKALDGFVSLEEVARAYPQGIHPRDVAWIWRRVLTAIGLAHSASVIHGAVLPPHVMIHSEDHGLTLVDWCYSVTGNHGRIPAIVSKHRQDYPAEVKDKETPSPGTDIYMAAQTMYYLMCPNVHGSAQLASFARGCSLSNPDRRPQNAWALISELDDLLERLFGPPKFHEFRMPEGWHR